MNEIVSRQIKDENINMNLFNRYYTKAALIQEEIICQKLEPTIDDINL